MRYEPGLVYHVYNRGNNRQLIFLREENYLFFLDKIRAHVLPYADVLCYCLMPNHFHFQLVPNDKGCTDKTPGVQNLVAAFRSIISSYTQAINKQEGRTGSLFQQKIKAKLGWGADAENKLIYNPNEPFVKMIPYIVTCFRYIHRNPVKARMVKYAYDWPHSSAKDYLGERDNGICNFQLAEELLGIRRLSGVQDYLKRISD